MTLLGTWNIADMSWNTDHHETVALRTSNLARWKAELSAHQSHQSGDTGASGAEISSCTAESEVVGPIG